MAEKKKAGAGAGGDIEFIRPSKLAEQGLVGALILEDAVFEGTVPNTLTEKEDFKFSKDGKTIILNSTGQLAHLMQEVSPGAVCDVKYLGKNEFTKNGKTISAHNFEVLYA